MLSCINIHNMFGTYTFIWKWIKLFLMESAVANNNGLHCKMYSIKLRCLNMMTIPRQTVEEHRVSLQSWKPTKPSFLLIHYGSNKELKKQSSRCKYITSHCNDTVLILLFDSWYVCMCHFKKTVVVHWQVQVIPRTQGWKHGLSDLSHSSQTLWHFLIGKIR